MPGTGQSPSRGYADNAGTDDADIHDARVTENKPGAVQVGTWEYQNQSTGISNFQTNYCLDSEKIVLPPEIVAENFHRLVNPLFEKITSNENLTLTTLRDTLLLRLMSGALRVRGLAAG